MKHYFTNNSDLKSNKKIIKVRFKEKEFEIYTDIGVFSKNELDFGTNVLLEEVVKEKLNKEKILDIGCGYGIVSLILKSYFKNIFLFLSDVNDRALLLAKENLEKYDIKDYHITNSNSFENIFENFDLIISNPPIRAGKKTIFDIYENSYKHLNFGGKFFCVIQTKHGAKSTEKKLIEIFSNCKTLNIKSGYRVFMCEKS